MLLASCSGSGDVTVVPSTPTSTLSTSTPLATATAPPPATNTALATATTPPPATSTALATATAPPATSTTAPSPTPETETASSGPEKYDGISYVVSTGSEATFTVEEQLVRLDLPNDAVLRTTALSGEVHLDGRPSVIQIDLQTLSSDQRFRDQYVRTRMFGEYPTATFTLSDIDHIPDGLALGEEVMAQVTGSLEIRGNTFPIGFEIEARDDGDTMFILGRTTFTWDQLDIPPPSARSVASIEDEVRVEILLAVVPQK